MTTVLSYFLYVILTLVVVALVASLYWIIKMLITAHKVAKAFAKEDKRRQSMKAHPSYTSLDVLGRTDKMIGKED